MQTLLDTKNIFKKKKRKDRASNKSGEIIAYI